MSLPLLVALRGASGAFYIGLVRGEECTGSAQRREPGMRASQFPVMEGGQVLGSISALEIIQLAAHSQMIWKADTDLPSTKNRFGPGVLGKIADVTEAADLNLLLLFPPGRQRIERDGDSQRTSVIFRFHNPALVKTACLPMAASAAGKATRLPAPMPAFKHKPEAIMALIHQNIGKALDQVGIEQQLFKRWDGQEFKEQSNAGVRMAL